jgi:N-methylhydantoinase A
MYRVSFDVGGTFTDFTIHDEASDAVRHFKVPSTPADPSEAIEAGLAALIAELGIQPRNIGFVGHGTTVVTNMVIERRGVSVGLITTKGFRDVLEIGRQTRPNLYDYSVGKPEPLVPRQRRIEVAERLDVEGRTLIALDEEAVRNAARQLVADGVQAIAICFLHSYLDDAHERRAAQIVREVAPDLYVSTSSGVLPEFREYERFSTTVINAYVGPRMDGYLDRFITRLDRLGFATQPYTIHSNGGLMSVATVRDYPVRTSLSGPAAGVVGAAELGKTAGFANLITFDAGGTSTDVSLIEAGAPAFASSRTVADYPVRTPMVDVHVIGAGGGSIAWIDDAGALKVGPHSAGADPGPVAYGRGGTEPTLTDANIVLHRLNPKTLLGGRMELDEAAARRVIAERIAAPLRLSVEDAALGIVRIAVANMSRAIRSVSTEKGHDLAEFALFPYGGAGPLHALAVAEECDIKRVLVPPEPGTMCARGILMSDLSLDFVKSEIILADAESWARIVAQFDGMRRRGLAWLDQEGVAEGRRSLLSIIDARYKGQNHEVQVRLEREPSIVAFAEFVAGFRAAHRREYGYDVDNLAIEVVNCRLKVVGAIERPPPRPPRRQEAKLLPRGRRNVRFAKEWLDTPVYERADMGAGARIDGPAVVEEMSSTTLVGPAQRLAVDAFGNLIVELRP